MKKSLILLSFYFATFILIGSVGFGQGSVFSIKTAKPGVFMTKEEFREVKPSITHPLKFIPKSFKDSYLIDSVVDGVYYCQFEDSMVLKKAFAGSGFEFFT